MVEQLNRLAKLKGTGRNYIPITNDISSSWYKCSIRPADRVKLIKWANENCVGKFSRDWQTYYFENEKDAFNCKLKWG